MGVGVGVHVCAFLRDPVTILSCQAVPDKLGVSRRRRVTVWLQRVPSSHTLLSTLLSPSFRPERPMSTCYDCHAATLVAAAAAHDFNQLRIA